MLRRLFLKLPAFSIIPLPALAQGFQEIELKPIEPLSAIQRLRDFADVFESQGRGCTCYLVTSQGRQFKCAIESIDPTPTSVTFCTSFYNLPDHDDTISHHIIVAPTGRILRTHFLHNVSLRGGNIAKFSVNHTLKVDFS